MNKSDFLELLRQKSQFVENALWQNFPAELYPTSIYEAMKYSLAAGGKRLRPVLVVAAAEAVGGDVNKVIPAACAMEMIHTYSLIHDDLPAMDNDDYRRGKLTNHKVYGDARAILAGDALLTMSFGLLAQIATTQDVDPLLVLQIINEISQAAGATGMIGGQVVDLESENKSIDADTLMYIHAHKTGALYRASLRSGAILAGARAEQLTALTKYAHYLGMAFQITDDILDIEGDTEKLGKEIGSDIRKQKATYPSIFGLEKSKSMAAEAVQMAIDHLNNFAAEADFLRAMAVYLLERDH